MKMTFMYVIFLDLSLSMIMLYARVSSVAFRLNAAPEAVTVKGVIVFVYIIINVDAV